MRTDVLLIIPHVCSRNLRQNQKATDMDDETEWMPNRRKITERTCIATLDTRGCRPTRGAQSCRGHGAQGQCDLLCHFYPFHFYIEKIEKNDHRNSFVLHKQNKSEKMFNLLLYHILDQQSCVRFTL